MGGGYGYLWVSKGRKVLVHRLVEELTNGPLPPGVIVRHRCDLRACCNPTHIKRGSQVQNMRECASRGRLNTRPSVGEANGNAKLAADVVMAMRERYAVGDITQRALAQEFGIAHSLVSRVVSGKAWRHLPLSERSTVHGPGLCACGCGQAAPIARMTNRRKGHVKGEPMRFIRGHSGRFVA